jgi:hypothetical protein
MELAEFRTKPSWEEHEEELLRRGFDPYWDPEIAAKIPIITCCSCGETPAYVGMTNADTSFGFLACEPACGEWIWFLAPTASTRP